MTTVMMEPGARVFIREEILLGRHGEQPGTIRQHLRICLAGQPLYDQDLVLGAGVEGWDGPAVLGGRRALGSVLIVDPALDRDGGDAPASLPETDTAVFPLSGPALQVTSIAPDGLALRRRLDGAVEGIEAALWQRCEEEQDVGQAPGDEARHCDSARMRREASVFTL